MTMDNIGRGLDAVKENRMRFPSELLNPPPMDNSEPKLMRIYDVYMTSDGRIEGEQQRIPEVLEGGDILFRDVAPSKPARGRQPIRPASGYGAIGDFQGTIWELLGLPSTVTAEAAGSSPVVPAMPIKRLQGIGNFAPGPIDLRGVDRRVSISSPNWFHDWAKSCSGGRFGGVEDTGDGILIRARPVPANR